MNPTILIVDDEKHTREGLRASLEDNFDVYVAADIGGALGVLEREKCGSRAHRSAARRRGRHDADRQGARAAASAGRAS